VIQNRIVFGSITAGGKGVLIGGPIGAEAGKAAAFITGKKEVSLPPETPLTFTLAEPLTINAKG
jgi:hypothetical protein